MLKQLKSIIRKERNIFVFSFIFFGIICLALTGSVSYRFKNEDNVNVSVSKLSYLSSNEFELKLQNIINDSFDNYLKEYSIYFNLDGLKVVEFARNVTDNYSKGFNEILGEDVSSYSTEGKVILFVYYLSRNRLAKSLSEFEVDINYFKTSNSIVTLNNDLILRNGLSYSEFLGEVCDNLKMDKNYLLAISYLETGRVTSGLAMYSNNFGGIRVGGQFLSYVSPEAGIISYILNLKGYEDYNLSSIYELSGIYVNGKVWNPSYTWVNSVMRYYDKIVENPNQYFLEKDV